MPRGAHVRLGSIHDLPPDAFNYVWDNAIEPTLAVESGEVVELHARDAGGGLGVGPTG